MDYYSELYSRVNVVSEEALMAMESLSTMPWMSLIASQHWKKSNKLWPKSPPVRPPGMIAYLFKSLSVQKEHSSRNYMRYLANVGEKVRFHRT